MISEDLQHPKPPGEITFELLSARQGELPKASNAQRYAFDFNQLSPSAP
jgi:hypothetical protein